MFMGPHSTIDILHVELSVRHNWFIMPNDLHKPTFTTQIGIHDGNHSNIGSLGLGTLHDRDKDDLTHNFRGNPF